MRGARRGSEEPGDGAPGEVHRRVRSRRACGCARTAICMPLLEQYAAELPALFIVSQVALERRRGAETSRRQSSAPPAPSASAAGSTPTDVGSNPEFPTICATCAEAVTEILNE